MKRMLLTIAYDGTAFHGWQVQPNGITVQETLQNALERLLGTRPAVTGCSRTDAGVHAREFCCHFDCEEKFPESAFLRGLDSLLPPDIAVKGVKKVANDFHARYNACGKTYAYYISNSRFRDPFLSRYSWQIERPLDLEKINRFCEQITGEHDFYAFSSSGRSVEDTVRRVSLCRAERQGDMIILKITANGFLYNMVRIIAGTLVYVGAGKMTREDVEKVLESGDRTLAGKTLPPEGLTLVSVEYGD